MTASGVHVVTGAFGYSGRYIARRLLDQGCTVRTLRTIRGRPARWATPCRPCRCDFDRPERLAESLAGVSVLYNTYWVRFNHRDFTFAEAVRNSRTLFRAARQAGVERIVHTSITNPSLDSPLEYFRGKAELEQALNDCGVSVRHPSPGRALRRRRHPHQQHGLDAAPLAGVRPVRPGRLPLAADSRGRLRIAGRGRRAGNAIT